MNKPTPARLGDTPDWLPEQGQRRASTVPGFDPEETLSKLRAARDTDAYALSPALSPRSLTGNSWLVRALVGDAPRAVRER